MLAPDCQTGCSALQCTGCCLLRRWVKSAVCLQIAPYLPSFVLSILPELTQRLVSRIFARFLREGLLLPA